MSNADNPNIPAAVRAQDAAADAALAELEKLRTGEVAASPENSSETQANTQDTLTEAPNQPTTPTAEPLKVEPKVEKSETVDSENTTKLEARLKVLQGKYDNEVPRYAARLKELEQQNDTLKDNLDSEKERSAELMADPESWKKYLTDEEKEGIDPEVLELQSRASRGVAEDVITKKTRDLVDKISDMESVMSDLKASQASAEDKTFWSAAETLAPGIAEANAAADAEWVGFLEKVEPVSNRPYRVIGQDAIARGDAVAVANLFNLHKSQQEPAEVPSRVTAETQVKPETVHSAPRTAQAPSGSVIKESEIKAFYRNAASKRFSEAEISAKEAEFDQAANEGRIIFGR